MWLSSPFTESFLGKGALKFCCITEFFPDNVPSISNGEMATFFKKTIAPQMCL
ncbi:hypothetical protein F2Q68_00012365 [Brassica cretica]|uniref:Uncharacterized protein n=1 Tax=Brassica cretica TaxID=69181 RepID=A0A8S9KQ29_BRACR|nr:hypothetical protein F2Q68_00012365 [Brassica cretica]